MDSTSPSDRRRLAVVIAVAAACLLALAAVLVAQPWHDDDPSRHSAAGNKAPQASEDPQSVTPGAATAGTADGGEGSGPVDGSTKEPEPGESTALPVAPEQSPVAPNETAQGDDGVVLSLRKIESVTGKAVAAGETSGPAVRITVEVMNRSKAPVDLGYVVVNAYTGRSRTPAPTVMQPGGKPFNGQLGVGGRARGVYLFTIAKRDRRDVWIAVDYRDGQKTAVFRGSLR